MSKRVRYAFTALAAVGLFSLAFRNYGQMPTLDTLRGGVGTALSNSGSGRPVAQSPPYDEDHINWSRFAYTQYVTSDTYLCNSVMIFETLYRLGSRADRVMMYPREMLDPKATEATTEEGKLIIKARDIYKVKLVPVAVQRKSGGDGTSYKTSLPTPSSHATLNTDILTTRSPQIPGLTHSPNSSPSIRPNTTECSSSILTPPYFRPWTSSSYCRHAPLPCHEHTGYSPTTRPSRLS